MDPTVRSSVLEHPSSALNYPRPKYIWDKTKSPPFVIGTPTFALTGQRYLLRSLLQLVIYGKRYKNYTSYIQDKAILQAWSFLGCDILDDWLFFSLLFSQIFLLCWDVTLIIFFKCYFLKRLKGDTPECSLWFSMGSRVVNDYFWAVC